MGYLLNHVFLFAAWAAYYIIHSLLADRRIKDLIMDNLKLDKQKYRLLYNFLAIATLLIPLYLQLTINSKLLFLSKGILQVVALALSTTGVWVIMRAMKVYNGRKFLGLKPEAEEDQHLVTSGLNAYVRHPLYSGTLLILMGYFLFNPKHSSLILLTVSVLYIIVGAKLEERKLTKVFGDVYKEYRKKVPMLIPNLFRHP